MVTVEIVTSIIIMIITAIIQRALFIRRTYPQVQSMNSTDTCMWNAHVRSICVLSTECHTLYMCVAHADTCVLYILISCMFVARDEFINKKKHCKH